MKRHRTLLRGLLSLLLALASVPSWACVRSCDTRGASLDCVRLCRHSQALLTQGGQLASVGQASCGVQVRDGALTESVAAVEPGAPALAALPAPVLPNFCLPVERPQAAEGRGPPSPSAYLSAEHPSAHAPPSFV